MSRPATADISVWIGATFAQSYELQDEDGTAFDLAGSTLHWRAISTDSADVFEYISGVNDEVTIDDEAGGEITLSLPASMTREIPTGRMTRYELERRVDGSEEVLIAGFIIGEGGANADA
jgi:hypothetical protein